MINETMTRNDKGEYLCQCICGCGEFWARAPHAIYKTHECRKAIRTKRRHTETPLKSQRKQNRCLGLKCDALVEAPLHFCARCKELKSKYSTGADWWGAVI